MLPAGWRECLSSLLMESEPLSFGWWGGMHSWMNPGK